MRSFPPPICLFPGASRLFPLRGIRPCERAKDYSDKTKAQPGQASLSGPGLYRMNNNPVQNATGPRPPPTAGNTGP